MDRPHERRAAALEADARRRGGLAARGSLSLVVATRDG
jgi:hypothetical protein